MDEEDGSFTREQVAKALKSMMEEQAGESCRKKASEMREVLADNKIPGEAYG